ncbi:MAG: hypothetical protein WD270_00305 [Acetobacterales bacterium]
MGALSHFLEHDGIATTGISLIRLHSERIRPPRALWVPFELGRPLGVPGDAAFQRKVLDAAFGLLGRQQGPVLEDFPEDAPETGAPADVAVCPVNLPPPPVDEKAGGGYRAALEAEVASLAPWYELSLRNRGRTTFGLSGMAPAALPAFLTGFLDGTPENPDPGRPLANNLKLAADDLRAFYQEAVTAQPGSASGRRVEDWMWNETVLGKVLMALSDACAASDDPVLARIGGKSLVPRRIALQHGRPI